MKIIKLDKNSQEKILSLAEKILRGGGIVIAPTDTVYGILADARNSEAVQKIFTFKKRPLDKPLPIFVKNIEEARRYAYIYDFQTAFLRRVWPGAVTVIFLHKKKLSEIMTGSSDKIGIRIPAHPFVLELLSRLDFPLAQTSANLSALPPAKDIEELQGYFKNSAPKPDLVIDGGVIENQASSVVDFSGPKPVILRSGFVPEEEIEKILRATIF